MRDNSLIFYEFDSYTDHQIAQFSLRSHQMVHFPCGIAQVSTINSDLIRPVNVYPARVYLWQIRKPFWIPF